MLKYEKSAPSAQDAETARLLAQRLSKFEGIDEPVNLKVGASGKRETIALPAGAVKFLLGVLEKIAAGQGVIPVSENAELTTVQAAEVLNVSRPYLIKLLDEKAIPHRKVGTHRRVLMEDVMAYKNDIDRKREKVLDELVREAEKLNMGYDV